MTAMAPVVKSRWYVWIFCYCLASALHWIIKPHPVGPPVHLDPSLYVFYSSIFAPAFCVFITLSIIRGTTNWMERTFLVLIELVLVLGIISTLQRLGYMPSLVSPLVGHWTFFAATVLLGFRVDQVLKYQDSICAPQLRVLRD